MIPEKDEWQKAGFRKEALAQSVVHSKPFGKVEILVVCEVCGSILRAEWRAGDVKLFSPQALLCVERCGCAMPERECLKCGHGERYLKEGEPTADDQPTCGEGRAINDPCGCLCVFEEPTA